MSLTRHLIVPLIAAAMSTPAWAQCELQKLVPSDGETFDEFGNSVAISGNVIVVGAHLDDDDAEDAGAVYVYRYDGSSWNQEAKLLASVAVSNNQFSAAVSVSGDAIAVAKLRLDSNQTELYLFRYDGRSWVEQANFTVAGDGPPVSAAISGDVAIIGLVGCAKGKYTIDTVQGPLYSDTAPRPSGDGWMEYEDTKGRTIGSGRRL